MFLQLTTAIGALLGCLVGLLFHSIGTQLWTTQTFLPITAGGFIYIATVSVIPELLETNGGFKQSVLEMLALIVGVALMVLVALYEWKTKKIETNSQYLSFIVALYLFYLSKVK